MITDLAFIFQWWVLFFIIGIIFLPLTTLIFSSFIDRGYIFSKIIGIAFISYAVFLLGIFKILPFSITTLLFISILFAGINVLILKRYPTLTIKQLRNATIRIFIFEELLFFIGIVFWSYIRGFQPDIHGLEKYMDYGFINSILRSEYLPPKDMWFTPLSINYYYFGHLFTAILTKASFIPLQITYNLMLATIFAFTFTCSFSIGANLLYSLSRNIIGVVEVGGRSRQRAVRSHHEVARLERALTGGRLLTGPLIGGLLTAFLTTFAGNLHTIYTFFKPYVNENPVPFWQLAFSPSTFPNNYWYPNATRFIQNTIHEFPMYSFVVSDLHGHVLDIPFVLLTIAILLSLIQNAKFKMQNYNSKFKIFNFKLPLLTLLAFMLAITYMTNAWDGIIYFLLSVFVILYINLKSNAYTNNKESIKYSVLSTMRAKNYILHTTYYILLILAGFFLFSLPFSLNFKPFVSGIGVLCAPEFATNIGKLGPLLFEKDHCQQSPWWQLLILHGFFYFWVISFIIFIFKNLKIRNLSLIKNLKLKIKNLEISDIFVLILVLLSTLLIIIPEFIYAKDIYPAHYRANTMFKLVYQAFIMLSISSGYIIMRLISHDKTQNSKLKTEINSKSQKFKKIGFWIFGFGIFTLVAIYPYFATTSYYGNLTTYYGLDGTAYLKRLYPTDYEAISWINKNIKGQPIILEAQGDSYTDFARISTHTGLPTLLGWTVHEWLWRGSYDIPSPRIEEIKTLYEAKDDNAVKQLIKKYKIELIFIGDLERQKYTNLNEDKLQQYGKIIYQNGKTKIYQIL